MIRIEKEIRKKEDGGGPPLPPMEPGKTRRDWKDFVRERKEILPKEVLKKRDKQGE